MRKREQIVDEAMAEKTESAWRVHFAAQAGNKVLLSVSSGANVTIVWADDPFRPASNQERPRNSRTPNLPNYPQKQSRSCTVVVDFTFYCYACCPN